MEIDHDGSYSIFSDITSFAQGMKNVDNILYASTNYSTRGGVIGFGLNTEEIVFEWLSEVMHDMANCITADWEQLTVDFEGFSIFDVSEWAWDFGDGAAACGPSSTHTYNTPGLYDVKIRAVALNGDTLARIYPRHVFCLADTIGMGSVEVSGDEEVEIVMYMHNSVPVREIIVPIEYGGEAGLSYDSFSVAGCRSENYGLVQQVDFDESLKQMAFRLMPRNGSPLYEKAGYGPIIKLYFNTINLLPGQDITLSLQGYEAQSMPTFVANGLTFTPEPMNGSVSYPFLCSDANSDGKANVTDAVYLINYVFNGGTAPDCV